MSFNDIQPWIYTILFGSMSCLVISNNIWHLIKSIKNQEQTSFTLFIGAIFGIIALLTAPNIYLKWLSILVIIIDPGTSIVIYQIIKNKKNSDEA